MAKKVNKRNVRKTAETKSSFVQLSQRFKKSLKWVLGLMAGVSLTLSLVFIAIWTAGVDTGNWFQLNRLEVKGQKYTQANELYEVFNDIEKRGFFSLDVAATEELIIGLPWIKRVQLRKVWPATLSLQVIEHEPLAFWGGTGVVSKEGTVFYPEQLPNENWVSLNGPEKIASELTELLQDYQLELSKKELVVSSINLSERGAVDITLADGIEVKLGNYQVAERLGRFLSQVDNLKSYKKDPLAYVDLRYQNGLVVAWNTDSSEQASVLNDNSNR